VVLGSIPFLENYRTYQILKKSFVTKLVVVGKGGACICADNEGALTIFINESNFPKADTGQGQAQGTATTDDQL
jgi:hypothetical protein